MDIKKVFIATLAALILNAGIAAAAAVYPLNGTKHDLSSASTFSYKAKILSQGGTDEKCIFCHTPHSAKSDAPLWNRAASTAIYTPYTSDVIAGLPSYPAAEDPGATASPGFVAHSKTRICLSCHDGTIALGSVVNMPNTITGDIQMSGNSMIQPSSPGYLGIDLRDDHPVAIKYDSTKDMELVSSGSLAGKVRLYADSGGRAVVSKVDGSYVECTSCHNAHDNQYGKFLIETNQNSALCIRCHAKTGFDSTRAHTDNSINVDYAPATGGNPANHGPKVYDVKCMNCHFPHKAGVVDPAVPNPTSGKYLLSFREEASCFNNNDRFGQTNVAACHGAFAPAGQRRIESELSSNSRHNMGNYADKHQAIEVKAGTANGWFSSSVWHVECADCHNPHTAGTVLHSKGTNTVSTSSSLYGVAYVSVSGGYPSGSWAAPVSFSPVEPLGATTSASWGATPVKEYEICFKCHSYFASAGGNLPNAYSIPQQMSDQSKEFNSTTSFHPVVTSNTNTWGVMTNGWTTGSQLMYCSDCHTKENLSRPQGPHGSTNSYMLSYAYYNDTAAKGSSADSSGTLCLQCHDQGTYSTGGGSDSTGFYTTGGTNLHTQHYSVSGLGGSSFAYRCINCHIRTSHGWDRKGMIHRQGDNTSHLNGNWYEPVSGPTITGLNLPASRGYAHGDANKSVNCQTVAGCH